MGMQTTVFFTFWGLFPLVKNDVRITGENWMQKMMSMMNRAGTEHLSSAKMNFAGAGPAMMKKLAERAQRRASPSELLEIARELGVRLIPCQMTMDLLGLQPRRPDRRARGARRGDHRAARGAGRRDAVHLSSSGVNCHAYADRAGRHVLICNIFDEDEQEAHRQERDAHDLHRFLGIHTRPFRDSVA